jgi:ABC-type transport system substrate-binding protein
VFDSEKELNPWVAKSWDTEDNGFTYSIEIHENVVDSEGNAITAADIVWFIEKSMEAKLKPVFAKVESVSVTGDYTLDIKLKSNIVGTIQTILTDTFVISQKAFEASADEFGSAVVTTSPYKVTEFTASSTLTFEKRDDYWQDENNLPETVRPMVEKLRYHTISEASQMGIALETGVIDLALDVPASTGEQFVDNSQFTVSLSEHVQGYQMFFSGADTSVVADDVKLRQAICYAIDAEGLIAGLANGYATQMWDPASTQMIGFNEKWKEEDYYTYDREKAIQLLEESGYNGETLSLLGVSTTFNQQMAQIIQNYLGDIGVKVELNLVDMALYTSIRLDGTQYDMVLNTIGGSYLADHWAIRYDPAAYPSGDATSRKDEVLAELLYKTWTAEGWTEENIEEVHDYLVENVISYGLVAPLVFTIWNNDIALEKEVKEFAGYIAPAASTYGNY